MANFAVKVSEDTLSRLTGIMDAYSCEGDKKEDTLVRIFATAEAEQVKGTHPELAGRLKDVEHTINTLIQQINGVVAGQDFQIDQLKERVEKVLEDKRNALEKATALSEEAKNRIEQANDEITKAQDEAEEKRKAFEEEMLMQLEKERSALAAAEERIAQLTKERDASTALAEERTNANQLLKDALFEQKAENEKLLEMKKLYDEALAREATLREEIKKKEHVIDDLNKAAFYADNRHKEDLEHQLKEATSAALLEKERAVMDKEREMWDMIKKVETEKALLEARLEAAEKNS